MLLGGEFRDSTGKPFGEGKNPKTVYLPENTPIEDRAYAALTRELNSAAQIFETEIGALMAELEKIPDWPGPTPNELDIEVSRLIQLKLLIEELARLFDPHGGSVRRARVGFRGNDTRTDLAQTFFIGARVRIYTKEERAKKPKGAKGRAVERVVKETGLGTRRIYELLKEDERIMSLIEPTDDNTEVG